MNFSLDDTICAIASPHGGATRGIIRISGKDSLSLLEKFLSETDQSGKEHDRNIRTGAWRIDKTIDSNIQSLPCHVLVWPDERSYTRQPSLEIHTTGSIPLLELLLESICTAGPRLAEPGEFTMRAFLAGRIDLTQAEAVMGVISAETDTELKISLEQLAGGLAGPLSELRDKLLELLAHLEAGLDFVEEDIEFISAEELDAQLGIIDSKLQQIFDQVNSRGRSNQLPRVVLIGEPNAGKSSLFNAIARKPVAIVTAEAGTTRDFLEVEVNLDGFQFSLIDTAGLEEASQVSGPRAEAQKQTQTQRERADLILHCIESNLIENQLDEMDADTDRLIVVTKSDLANDRKPSESSFPGKRIENIVATSASTGNGIDELLEKMKQTLENQKRTRAQVVSETAQRCASSLSLASSAISESREMARSSLGEELVAEKMRQALDELGKVAGVVYTDDILDRVFSRFCIGK